MSAIAAALLEPYTSELPCPLNPARDATVTICPPPARRMWRIAARQHQNTPYALIAKIRSKSSGVMPSTSASATGRVAPALLIRKSSPPSSATTESTMPVTAASSATSAWQAMARTPCACASATVRSASSIERE